jgi:uncharacterized protein (TIGR00299 family) protein
MFRFVEVSDLRFANFLRGFACDAKGGDRTSFQALDSDFAAALFASPVRTIFDSRKGVADFAEQLALAIAHPQQEIAIRFQRRPIGRVGERLFRLMIHSADRALGLLEDVALAAFEQLFKELELPLPHVELTAQCRVFDSIDALLPCKDCTMKTAYLDAFSGLSGDMMVGAILDCGADFVEFENAIKSIPIAGYRLSTRRKTLSGISALKFDVAVTEHQPERHFGEIRALIEASKLAVTIKNRAISIFEALAQAEAKVHNTTTDRVHFHEVGAVDSIIDIVGAAWGLERLGVNDVLVSPLPMGNGFARSQHGVIPVPAPATAELLSGFPLKLGDGAHEMVTPTGAAIVRALARPAVMPLKFEVEKVGYGAGERELEDRPNVLRLMLGQERAVFDSDAMIEISANIDDLSPQIYDHVMNRLFEAGARDVTLTPTMMKKGRPAVTLGVIAEAARRDAIAGIIFDETSTIGLRFHVVERLKLRREIYEVETRWGKVRVKVSAADHLHATVSPEYDDCRRIATEHKIPLRVVMDEARDAARAQEK